MCHIDGCKNENVGKLLFEFRSGNKAELDSLCQEHLDKLDLYLEGTISWTYFKHLL